MAACRYLLLAVFALGMVEPARATDGSPERSLQVKPSEIRLPEGAELGKYRRMIRPFENWELICDENLKSMTKVCNVTQSIVDGDGRFVFGWSLAGGEDGKPMMILRTEPEVGAGQPIRLAVHGREAPVIVRAHACNGAVCTAYMPVGPIMREQIGAGRVVRVSYTAAQGRQVDLEAPLAGLSAALAAID